MVFYRKRTRFFALFLLTVMAFGGNTAVQAAEVPKSADITEKQAIYLADEEIELLVRSVAFSAKGSMRVDGRINTKNAAPYAARVGMMATVLNRLRDPRFPDSVPQIIASDKTFSPTASAEKLDQYDLAITRAALHAALDGADPSNGALYFTLYLGDPTEEAGRYTKTASIDGYCFYIP